MWNSMFKYILGCLKNSYGKYFKSKLEHDLLNISLLNNVLANFFNGIIVL